MRFSVASAALCLVLSLTAQAQVASPPAQKIEARKIEARQVQSISPEKTALIKELFDAIDFRKSSEAIFKAMYDQMEKEIPEAVWRGLADTKEIKDLSWTEQQRLYNELKERAEQSGIRFREQLNQRVDFAKITEEISVELYAKFFTENELRDLIVFYKSPTGKKSMEVAPSLISESMAQASERLNPVIRDVMDKISKDEGEKFQKEFDSLVKLVQKPAPATRNKGRKARTKRQ